jgi:hypothetical protein
MRRLPAPLSVTLPPPSSTIRGPCAFRTLAMAVMVIVTGAGPQLNVMMPPAATALTTAAEVQLAGLPEPMTWSGWLVSTARASAGTDAWPFALPGRGSAGTLLGVAVGRAVADGVAPLEGSGTALDASGATNVGAASWFVPQAASIAAPTTADTVIRRIRTGGC